ncbi:MAG TPA: hypothetical protein VE091_10615 [Gemmatimonadales bacterium]|nr:hypothetical protein [Gemmatimonadales bacterium]
MKSRMVVVAAVWLVTACYSYRQAGPADAVAPATGSHVQVRLTQQGALALAQQIGPQAVSVDGDVISATPDTFRLAVRGVRDARGISTDWKGEQVAIPRDAIASVGERRLAVGATALVGGLAAGSVIAAAAVFSGAGASTGQVVPPAQGHQ